MARSSEIAKVFGAVLSSRALRQVLAAFFLFTTAEYADLDRRDGLCLRPRRGHGRRPRDGGATRARRARGAVGRDPGRPAPSRSCPRPRLRRAGGRDTALALALWGGPPLLAYGFAVVANCAVALTRPVHYAILPQLAETPDELTASNGASAAVENLGVLVGPLLAASLIGVGGSQTVAAISAVWCWRPARSRSACGSPATQGARRKSTGRIMPTEPRRLIVDAIAGFRELHHEPGAWPLLLLGGAQFVVVGLLDVFYAVLAISVLDVGDRGPGCSPRWSGSAGWWAPDCTALLVGRQRLTPGDGAGPVRLRPFPVCRGARRRGVRRHGRAAPALRGRAGVLRCGDADPAPAVRSR